MINSSVLSTSEIQTDTDVTAYYKNKITKKLDPSTVLEFKFVPKGTGFNQDRLTEIKRNTYPKIKVYKTSTEGEITDTNCVASTELKNLTITEEWDASQHAAYVVTLTVPANVLNENNQYALVFDKSIYGNQSSVPLGKDIVFFFETGANGSGNGGSSGQGPDDNQPENAYGFQGVGGNTLKLVNPDKITFDEESTYVVEEDDETVSYKWYKNSLQDDINICANEAYKAEYIYFSYTMTSGVNSFDENKFNTYKSCINIHNEEETLVAPIELVGCSGGNITIKANMKDLNSGKYILRFGPKVSGNRDTKITNAYIDFTFNLVRHKQNLSRVDAKAPTCTEDGNIEHYKCTVCNKLFEDASGEKEITDADVVIKKKHTLTEVSRIEATCTADGREAYYTCSVCQKNFKDEQGTEEIATLDSIKIPAAHKLTKVEAKDATCSATGNKEYWDCTVCNKYFADADAQTEITDKDSVIIAIKPDAHTWDDGVVTKEATCTEEGVMTYTCQNNPDHTKTDVITKKAHTLTKINKKEATCSAEGNIEYWTCSVCDKYFADADAQTEITDKDSVIITINPDAHAWNDATCTAPKTCSACGTTDGVALGHDWEEKWTSDKNSHWHKCTRCSEKTEIGEHTPDREGNATLEYPILCDKCGYVIEAQLTPPDYKITSGANSTWELNSDGSLTITGNGDFAKFLYVNVDGKKIDESNYVAKEGSTIITLKPEYLNTLSAGTHTFEIVWKDGVASTEFTVKAAADGAPQTGDDMSITLYVLIMLAALAGAACVVFYRRQRQ